MTRIAWLFDIDGTLVDTTDLHVSVYKEVYKRTTGHVISDSIIKSRFGMPATKGHDLVFCAAQIPFTQQTIDETVAEHKRVFAALLVSHEIKPLPGVVEFLSALQREKDILGIVTGNFEPIAKNILDKAGLLSFFQFLSCDDGQGTRDAIVSHALARVRQICTVGKCVVIGDTPSDIRAGKKTGAITIGVTTGFFPAQVLEQEGADIVAKNFKDYPAIMRAIKQ